MRRLWPPYLLIGLSFALLLIIVFAVDWDRPPAAPPLPPPAAISVEEYQANLKTILDQYAVDHDANRARAALLQMRVPKDYLQFHLNTVISFEEQPPIL